MGHLFPKLYPSLLCYKLLSPLGVEARKNIVRQTPSSQDLTTPLCTGITQTPDAVNLRSPGPTDLDSLDHLGQV